MDFIELNNILKNLREERKIFHSEADFQQVLMVYSKEIS